MFIVIILTWSYQNTFQWKCWTVKNLNKRTRIIKLFFHFLSQGSSDWIQTHDLKILSQVFYHCATGVWSIGLHHPLDGVTNPEYKLLHFIQPSKFFCKEDKALAFNWDRCCNLALCLQLILFHYNQIYFSVIL